MRVLLKALPSLARAVWSHNERTSVAAVGRVAYKSLVGPAVVFVLRATPLVRSECRAPMTRGIGAGAVDKSEWNVVTDG